MMIFPERIKELAPTLVELINQAYIENLINYDK